MYSVGAPIPPRRADHAAVCLDYKTNNPQLVVIGGAYDDDYYNEQTLSDVWCLDVLTQSWQLVRSCIIYIIIRSSVSYDDKNVCIHE